MALSEARASIIQAAIDLTITDGWSEITMERVAQRAGVSRQTVYNEIGNKADLARVMVQYELGAFLAIVDQAFAECAEPEVAVRRAAERVLHFGEHHPLLGVIVAGGASDLLALLTIDAEQIRNAAITHLHQLHPQFTAAFTDVVVRLILSYLTQPSPAAREHLDLVISALVAHQSRHMQQ
jgi:AcrR family transcriptional regulator